MYILYHLNTIKQIGQNSYNSLADAELAKQQLSKVLSEPTIGICEPSELEHMKANRHAALRIAQSTMPSKRITLRVVGD